MGDLAESVRLASAVQADNAKGKDEKLARVPDLERWISKAKDRLAREENINALQVYTDRLIEMNKRNRVEQKL